jgi:hypothetical protein
MGEDDKGGLINALQSEIDKIDEIVGEKGAYEKWIGGIDNVIGEYEKLFDAIDKAKTAAAGMPELPEDYNKGGKFNHSMFNASEDDSKTSSSESEGETITQIPMGLYATPIGGGYRLKILEFEDGIIAEKLLNNVKGEFKYKISSQKGGFLGYTTLEDAMQIKGRGTTIGFDTGGYTGDWGPEGKLAMLHQKELVLNQQDTSNLLVAVDMLRAILNTIDIHAHNSQLGGILTSPSFHHDTSNILEQNVKIEASFPGVQDRHELEEAFNNLINKAS